MQIANFKINWLTPFDRHSIAHLCTGFIVLAAYGLFGATRETAFLIGWGASIFWEIVFDASGWFKWLVLTDPRGGCYYDLIYNTAGSSLAYWITGWGV